MKRLLAIIAFLALAACENTQSMYASDSPAATGDSLTPPPMFSHFTDIPIPEGSAMNVDRTFLLGAGEEWTGRLVFTSPYGQNKMFDFYMSEMPKFGWNEITVVRSQTSVLTFKRNSRIATIQLSGDKSSSYVELTVSPQNTSTAAASRPVNTPISIRNK